MRKQRIFIKIYLWFWLATAVVVASQITLDRITESGPPFDGMRHDVARPLAFFGRVARDLYFNGDPSSVSRMTETFRESTGIDAYLLDGRLELNGREAPEEVLELGTKAATRGRVVTSAGDDVGLVAIPLGDGDRGPLVVVGERAFHRPPLPPFMHSPFAPARILLVLSISGLVCYGLARYLSTPIIALRKATRRFAAGDLDVRIGKKIGNRKDEFSELADDFNHMAKRIGAFVVLQKQLLADISHELRSPLARLNVALELARRKTGPDAEKELSRIEHEADQMNQLVGQILTMRWMESGIDAIEKKSLDVGAMVRRVVSDAAFEAAGKNRKVVLRKADECRVTGNEELLHRAVENVVRNALHHTAENTTVEVRVERTTEEDAAYAQIRVRDHGAGVPEDHISHLFQPFYRASHARERDTGGVGLGLAITERSVKLHDGTVTAQNAEEGGLEVIIRLPLT